MSIRKVFCCCICNTCPDPGDTSSITSSDTRNEHSLKSGNELIDWIRLGNSGLDLTGVDGRVRLICPAELKKHNTRNDAWLAIRGRVYNITYYLSFHPGGSEELMRVAGTDATEIFDKIHPWINYDSLLVKCLVGTLRFDTLDNEIILDADDSFPELDLLIPSVTTQEKITKKTTVPKKKPQHYLAEDFPSMCDMKQEDLSFPENVGTFKFVKRGRYAENVPPAIFFDWEQSSTKLKIGIYTGPMSNPGAYLRISERSLIIEVTINGWVRTIRLMLEDIIQEPLCTSVCLESGKIEISAHKAESRMWRSCGEVTIGKPSKISLCHIIEYKVISNKYVTHDTRLLTVTPVFGYLVFPLGHHVRIHQTIAGSEYIRSYTPMGGFLDQSKTNTATQIQFTIKRYNNGILSPMLTSLRFEDVLKISGPYGTFQLYKLNSIKTIYLLAAGTGITPMLGLIQFMLSRSNPLCEHVHLFSFNKTVKDIMFQEHLEVLAKKDRRFKVVHILSNANSTWSGRRGRINMELISEILTETDITSNKGHFACICGPTEFSYAALNILKSLGMDENFMHVFIS